ncbi:hypothetical protein KDW49_11755 [Burkholderia dolosa]|uniref:gp53-like domain-containing protein n=1 Tax=Burkholderia dolosa TaxID=152500 RepID=UPI001B9D81F8|nr:hypothetical protein [Burkholderia dolosa]MBR8301384.1 hypothetical protein [Burkholderia dolosa]
MTNLIEIERWEDGIYQLKTSDPVVGGPDGIDNLQAKQLANRTRYLKKAIEARQSDFDAHVAADNPHPQYATLVQMKAAIEALVASAPGALDTLNELAAALGDDPNFATTITNALALKAALDSPEFIGTPRAPTPPQFDNSSLLATTAALKSAGFHFSTTKSVSASTALDESYVGAMTVVTGNTGPITLTLPPTANQPIASALCVLNQSPYAVTLARGDMGAIAAGGNPYNSITVGPGDTSVLASLSANANSNWELLAGSALNAFSVLFGSSLAGNGYQKFPRGLIIQWGLANLPTGNGDLVTLPLAMPNAILRIWSCDFGGGCNQTSSALNGSSRSSFLGYGKSPGTNTPTSTSYSYICIGC